MKYMRYAVGAFILYTVGYLGGDIIIVSIWMGIAYGSGWELPMDL